MLVSHTNLQECVALTELVLSRAKALKVRDRRTRAVVLTVTMSAGVTMMAPEDDAQALTVRADSALYEFKQNGPDQFTCA